MANVLKMLCSRLRGAIAVPKIDISDWKTVVTSLHETGNNIVVENESTDETLCRFANGEIGRFLA